MLYNNKAFVWTLFLLVVTFINSFEVPKLQEYIFADWHVSCKIFSVELNSCCFLTYILVSFFALLLITDVRQDRNFKLSIGSNDAVQPHK